jgi:hypothetical protein
MLGKIQNIRLIILSMHSRNRAVVPSGAFGERDTSIYKLRLLL